MPLPYCLQSIFNTFIHLMTKVFLAWSLMCIFLTALSLSSRYASLRKRASISLQTLMNRFSMISNSLLRWASSSSRYAQCFFFND